MASTEILNPSNINQVFTALAIPYMDGYYRADLAENWYNYPNFNNACGNALKYLLCRYAYSNLPYYQFKHYTSVHDNLYPFNNGRFRNPVATTVFSGDLEGYYLFIALTYLNRTPFTIHEIDMFLKVENTVGLIRSIIVSNSGTYFEGSGIYELDIEQEVQSKLVMRGNWVLSYDRYRGDYIDEPPCNKYAPALNHDHSYVSTTINSQLYIPYTAQPQFFNNDRFDLGWFRH